jgi:hypothetical protein
LRNEEKAGARNKLPKTIFGTLRRSFGFSEQKLICVGSPRQGKSLAGFVVMAKKIERSFV